MLNIIIILLLSLILLIFSYFIWRMHTIIKSYENFYINMKNYYLQTYTNLRSVDKNGSFESDDEIGFVFGYIKKTVEEINSNFFAGEDVEEDEEILKNRNRKDMMSSKIKKS